MWKHYNRQGNIHFLVIVLGESEVTDILEAYCELLNDYAGCDTKIQKLLDEVLAMKPLNNVKRLTETG